MEKERLGKVQRIVFLESQLWLLQTCYRSTRADVKRDFYSIEAEYIWELTRLYSELYPDPPKDLMEDVKKRIEAHKLAEDRTDSVKPPLTFKQKIGLLFRK